MRDARNLLLFLFESGVLADNVAVKMIKVSSASAPVLLPSAFKSEDIEKLLATVDKQSPAGKRDCAAILLVAKTGIRLSDIQNLKSENIDWDQNAINITQIKTKEPLSLPLTLDVGWALIDYITNGLISPLLAVLRSNSAIGCECSPYITSQRNAAHVRSVGGLGGGVYATACKLNDVFSPVLNIKLPAGRVGSIPCGAA